MKPKYQPLTSIGLTGSKIEGTLFTKKLHGEASSAALTAASYWKDNVLDIIRANSQDKDIFNLDETGIFYKMLPNSTKRRNL